MIAVILFTSASLIIWLCFLVATSSWPWWLVLGIAAASMWGFDRYLDGESRRYRLQYAREVRRMRQLTRVTDRRNGYCGE